MARLGPDKFPVAVVAEFIVFFKHPVHYFGVGTGPEAWVVEEPMIGASATRTPDRFVRHFF